MCDKFLTPELIIQIHYEFHQDYTRSVLKRSIEKSVRSLMNEVCPAKDLGVSKIFWTAGLYAALIGNGDWTTDRKRAVITGLVTAITFLDLNGFHVNANNPSLLSLIESPCMNSTKLGKVLFEQFCGERLEENKIASQTNSSKDITCGYGQQRIKPYSSLKDIITRIRSEFYPLHYDYSIDWDDVIPAVCH
ncbi:hypothetical protein [Idiomarina baltica]|uniref:Uncharacterized protein n=1 Tax=Idiomarina baltica OS145 TaxID=314276 RepID=A0ABM9WLE8_9GAMM|nr:hypothetical protein [Idiomarina baltica]EAQ31759.1 hypothetical protein OS145_06644 [Idiomarina baltica OS145]